MKVAFIAFTENGLSLAERLAQGLDQQGYETDVTCGFGSQKVNHKEWVYQWFSRADALVFIGATGIAVRSIAPYLQSKGSDPAVVVLDDRGQNCIPLLSGHLGGANELARTLSTFCAAHTIITTASDINKVFAVDSWAASQGIFVPELAGIKVITSALLKGDPVECVSAFPLEGTTPPGIRIIPVEDAYKDNGLRRFHVGCRTDAIADLDLIVPAAILGVGCRKGTTAEAIETSAALFLEQAGIHPSSLCCIASIDLKAQEPGLLEFAQNRQLPFETFTTESLNEQQGDFSTSEFVSHVTGTACVCERAAVAVGGYLMTRKTVVNGITFAIAIKPFPLSWPEPFLSDVFTTGDEVDASHAAAGTAPAAPAAATGAAAGAAGAVAGVAPDAAAPGAAAPAAAGGAAAAAGADAGAAPAAAAGTAPDADAVAGQAKGQLIVVGLGPGDPAFMSQEAVGALQDAQMICGYHVYIDLAKQLAPETPVFTTPMTKEIDRCRAALKMAAEGKRVAMVCSGDAGVYGMAGLCMELAHEFDPVDIRVIPGITAALSGASRLGAPLTHDFCVISLSDLLTPWDLIEQRLKAAADADFCVALYNPASHKRKDYLQKACDLLLSGKDPQTVCGVVRNIGRPGEEVWVGTLEELRNFPADMFCTAFVGNQSTVIIDGKMVTPRGYQRKRQWDKDDR